MFPIERDFHEYPFIILISYHIPYPIYFPRALLQKSGPPKPCSPFIICQDARLQRGMNFWTDVKDWLGGYPIEFSEAAEVIRFVKQRCGLVTWTCWLLRRRRDAGRPWLNFAVAPVVRRERFLARWGIHLPFSDSPFNGGSQLELLRVSQPHPMEWVISNYPTKKRI